MTPIEELDLARAKALCGEEFGDWRDMDDFTKDACLDMARAIRLSDEARGLRVVPVEATWEMIRAGCDAMNPILHGCTDVYRAMIAASPYAPEDGR